MTMLTDEQRAKLRELAASATPGEWFVIGVNEPSDRQVRTVARSRAAYVCVSSHRELRGDTDADYIAAVSPDVVVALLDEIDRLRAGVERLMRGDDTNRSLVEAIRAASLNANDLAVFEAHLGTYPHMMAVVRALREWLARGGIDG